MLPSNRIGGLELTMLHLSQALGDKHHLEILSINNLGTGIQSSQKINSLRSSRFIKSIPKLLRRTNNNTDIIVSSGTHINLTLSLLKKIGLLKPKLITVEHTLVTQYLAKTKPLKRMIIKHMLQYYKFSDRIICVSYAAKQDIGSYVKDLAIDVIYNPYRGRQEEDHRHLNRDYFLVVSRLVQEKNVEEAIKAYIEYRKLGGRKQLRLIGDGPEKKRLMEKYQSPCIIFLGAVEANADVYRGAIALLAPSRYEGLGNTVFEALFNGTAVIVNSVVSAFYEITDNGRFGNHVDYTNSQGVARMMLEEEKNRHGSFGFSDSEFSNRFTTSYAYAEYQMLLDKL